MGGGRLLPAAVERKRMGGAGEEVWCGIHRVRVLGGGGCLSRCEMVWEWNGQM